MAPQPRGDVGLDACEMAEAESRGCACRFSASVSE
jgi:hypothetical protein